MRRRLVLLTEIIAPYRIPVFNALAGLSQIDLHVIFLSENDPTLRQWWVYKDEIHFSYEVLRSWRCRYGRRNLLLNLGMSRALQRAAPQVILCGGYNYLASWQAMLWACRHRVPLLLWVESTSCDMRGNHRPIEFLKRNFLRACSGFVVPGRSSLGYLKGYGVREEIVFTAPNAVDIRNFAERAEAVSQEAARHRHALHLPPRFFLFVGRLVREKGVLELLEAYEHLKPELREQVGLVLVGDGALRDEVRRRASRIKPGSIRMPGFAQRDELARYYALAEALVFPTWTDAWGLVVNEAMACGLPVISSDAAGCIPDLIESSGNGWVFRKGDVRGLISAMDDLARNPLLRAEMGSRGREHIQQFSPKVWAESIAHAVCGFGASAHD